MLECLFKSSPRLLLCCLVAATAIGGLYWLMLPPVTAIAVRNAPSQAEKDVDAILLGVEMYYDTQGALPGTSISDDDLVVPMTSWRPIVGKSFVGAWNRSLDELPMPVAFRIPLTQSTQVQGDSTSVFMLFDKAQRDFFLAHRGKSWTELLQIDPMLPILVVIDDWSVDWRTKSLLMLVEGNDGIASNPLVVTLDQLPSRASRSRGAIVRLNGQIDHFENVKDLVKLVNR